MQKDGLFWRIIHDLQVTSDEGPLGELYVTAARQGSPLIAIYVPHREHLDAVSMILFHHGARLVKYIGTWWVEDISSPTPRGARLRWGSHGSGRRARVRRAAARAGTSAVRFNSFAGLGE